MHKTSVDTSGLDVNLPWCSFVFSYWALENSFKILGAPIQVQNKWMVIEGFEAWNAKRKITN